MNPRPDTSPDFQALFQGAPNLYLVLTPGLKIIAVNDAYCRATMTVREKILGQGLFDVFPDNPADTTATGVSNLRSSLDRVLQFRHPDAMAVQKYDIPRLASEGGGFEERYWSPLNTPVLDDDGEVVWIIHRVEDVTDLIHLQAQGAASDKLRQEQLSTIAQLRDANRLLAQRNEENAKLQQRVLARSEELQSEIAERKKTEETLKRASDFHNLVVENIPAMVFVKDANEHRFMLVNRAGEQLLGIDRSELIGKNDFDFFPRERAEFFIDRDQKVVESGVLQVTPEEPINTRHNGVRMLHTTKIPVFDEQGRPQYLVALCQDITERKYAETALQASEAMFRSLLAASPDVVVVVDQANRILLASHRVEVMFGYLPHELIGQPIGVLLPERYREAYANHLRDFMKAPELRSMDAGGDLHALRKDGSEFPTEISLSFNRSEEAQVVIAAVRDISDRMAVEMQLRQAQKMEVIGNLTGGMAHDFNNLLGVIIGNLDLLGERQKIDAESVELAREALNAALRGADLTRRLLAFARRQPLQPQRIDVNELVGGVSKLLGRTLVENIEITIDPGVDVWPVVADPAQLESSLVNLVTNAQDAMPMGGVLTIATSNRYLDENYAGSNPGLVPGDYTMIEVSDTGTGMPPVIVSQIFEPFFTTKERDKGTGLGLSMVFGFMKQSGGHINVYSEVGVGTTFRLFLPRALAGADAAVPAAVGRLVRGGSETILSVEDNASLRRVVARQLRELGYRLLEAGDGPAALKILESETVDLLFTDIVIPGGMSGYDLARTALLRWPAMKALLTSGFPEVKLNGNGGPPVNMRLLSKPYRKDDLARTLREVLDG